MVLLRGIHSSLNLYSYLYFNIEYQSDPPVRQLHASFCRSLIVPNIPKDPNAVGKLLFYDFKLLSS